MHFFQQINLDFYEEWLQFQMIYSYRKLIPDFGYSNRESMLASAVFSLVSGMNNKLLG